MRMGVIYRWRTEPKVKPVLFCKDEHLSDTFPIKNGLKQGDALSPLLLNFASEDVTTKVQANQRG